jgi:hypothetical protein
MARPGKAWSGKYAAAGPIGGSGGTAKSSGDALR